MSKPSDQKKNGTLSGKTEAPALALENISIAHEHLGDPRLLVRDVTLEVGTGEIVGLVGESGSGKTLTALSIVGICPIAPGIVGGSVSVDGRSVYSLDPSVEDVSNKTLKKRAREADRGGRSLRGSKVGYIFQEPMSAFDPLRSVRWHMERALRKHAVSSDREALQSESRRWLERVKLKNIDEVLDAYPDQLSGGMCQRVMIATVLAARPNIIVADESTTALDAITEFEIVGLIKKINREQGTAFLVITHNMALAIAVCSRFYVMLNGVIVEEVAVEGGAIGDRATLHPYTDKLLASLGGNKFDASGAS